MDRSPQNYRRPQNDNDDVPPPKNNIHNVNSNSNIININNKINGGSGGGASFVNASAVMGINRRTTNGFFLPSFEVIFLGPCCYARSLRQNDSGTVR